ncbi:MAG: xseA [Ilumatobacteraceae bacterium]|nr:xseA [Ilumatobacteraceae bacterium]
MSQAAFDFDLDDGGEPTYTVGELADAVNGVLRRQFGDGVWVRGEIQGYSEKNGHAYFKLVESGGERRAVLDVSFFANVRMRLRPLLQKHRLFLAEGMKVRVFGVLDLYAANGRLSLKMGGIDPRYTLGEMAMERDDVIRRLVASGLYDANAQHQLAAMPLRVGLVTSVNSAAWHDFMHQLQSSGHGFGVRVIDVRVQGDFAQEMLTDAIRTLGRRSDIDVLVVIRGGGSRTELAMFDAESIAVAIAEARMPVFTGLGHEIDRSIADEVAHTAFKTPTACAVALIEAVQSFAIRAESAWSAIAATSTRQVERSNAALLETARRIEQRTIGAVERAGLRLTDRAHRVSLSSVRVLDHGEAGLVRAADRLGRRPLQHVAQAAQSIDQIEARVRLLDPVHTLARGWSLTRTGDGRIVRSAADVAPGDEIVTTLATGSITSHVDTATPEGTST